MIAGTFVYQFEEARYKDITDGLRTQNGTQAATIQGQAATITQLREQLKGTSPELAAIQANRDRIRGALQNFYVQGGELFRRKVSDEPSLNKWLNDGNSWVTETEKWIAENAGAGRRPEVHQDQGNSADVGWSNSFNQIHVNARNMIARFRRNLLISDRNGSLGRTLRENETVTENIKTARQAETRELSSGSA